MKPYKCPICEGTTNVAKGFYVDEPKRTKCRACIQGVVYGSDSEPVTVPVPYPVPQPYPVPAPYPVYPPALPYYPGQPIWVKPRPWIWYGPNDSFGYTITSSGTSDTVTINGSQSASIASAVDTKFSVQS